MQKPLGIRQGRIHGNPVADGWAGAVMQKPLGQLGRDEVGDFTDSVVKLPTLVIFTRSNKVGDVGMVIHSFSFSFTKNS